MSNGFTPPPRPTTALDNKKLSMRATNAKGKTSSLNWQLVNNNPRIVVYTNDPDDTKDYGKITAALDAPTFFAFLRILEKAINSPDKFREKIDNLNFTFPGGKRSEQPSVVSSLIVGKDEGGAVWISVSAPGRPQIKFPFVNPDFHHFYKDNGQQYTKEECSDLYARSYHTMLSMLMANVLTNHWIEPPKKDANGGNNRGGGGGGGNRNGGGNWGDRKPNNNQGGGGGRSEPSTGGDDGDSDIPW